MTIAKVGYIIMSVVFLIVGGFFVFSPSHSIETVARALGIAMIVFGTIRIVGYFSKDLYRLAFQFDLQFGIILMALGAVMLIKPRSIINLTLIALGIVILSDALFKLKIALDSKRFGIGAWWVIILIAAITALIGLVAALRPWESARALTIVFGVALAAEGLLNLIVAILTVKIIKNQYPDVIDNRDDGR